MVFHEGMEASSAENVLDIPLQTRCLGCAKDVPTNDLGAFDLKIVGGWTVVCSRRCLGEVAEVVERKGGLILGLPLNRGEMSSAARRLLRNGMTLDEIASTIPTSIEYLKVIIQL